MKFKISYRFFLWHQVLGFKTVKLTSLVFSYSYFVSNFSNWLKIVQNVSSTVTVFANGLKSGALFWFSVKPAVIEVPRVRILNELYDTLDRQFTDGTAIRLICQGQVGSDGSNVRITGPGT